MARVHRADSRQDDSRSLALKDWVLSGQLGNPRAVVHGDLKVVAESSLDRVLPLIQQLCGHQDENRGEPLDTVCTPAPEDAVFRLVVLHNQLVQAQGKVSTLS
jgi:hypothetical protein